MGTGGCRVESCCKLQDAPEWRNGRRGGLKIRWSQGRVGSTPSSGTIAFCFLGSSRVFWLSCRQREKKLNPAPPRKMSRDRPPECQTRKINPRDCATYHAHGSTIPSYWTTEDRSPRQTSSLFHGCWGEWNSSSGAVKGRSFGTGCGFMNPSCFATTASSILAGRSLGKVQFLKRCLMTA